MKELLTYDIMLDSLIVAYVQYMIMLIDLQSAKSGPKVFVLQVYHSTIGMSHTKNYGYESFIILLH